MSKRWRNPWRRQFAPVCGDPKDPHNSWGYRALRWLTFCTQPIVLLHLRAGARHACERLRRERDKAREELWAATRTVDDLYGIALNYQKENGDLERRSMVAAHLFHTNGGGAIINELKEVRRLLGMSDGDGMTPAGVERVLAERDAALCELSAAEWLALHDHPVRRYPDGRVGWDDGNEWTGEVDNYRWPSFAVAARELGWEG